jgi:hypothetical protein
MKANNRLQVFVVAAVMAVFAAARPVQLVAEKTAQKWSVQVDRVDPGDVNLAPSFQIAIYENLVGELIKTKRFNDVFRDGDHKANDAPNLLTLKTTVERYTAGSETRRAVTTVTGATKLTVRSRLCNRDGQVVVERVVGGNVRFMGSNLRATHNLAHNVAKSIKQSSLPAFPQGAQTEGGQL